MDTHEVMSFLRALLPHPSISPERSSPNRAPIQRDAPHLEPSKNTQSTTPQVPQWTPEARDARLQNFLHLSLKVPGKWSPPTCPPSRSPWREKPNLQGQWLIHSFISVGVPNKEPAHKKRGKILSHHPWSPMWTEGLHTMGCGLVPHGDRLRHCNLYPSAVQPSARYLPPWLG